MALGLSIGDMIALTQLCYQVGKALSDGCGASEEFTGVQSLLYAIGEALKNLDAEVKKPDSIFAHEGRAKSLEILIYNCGLTLHRLEKLVKEYAPALGSGGSSKSFVKKFHDGWQKVMWVKEGPQLAILTGQLAVHQGALGLFTNTTNSAELAKIAAGQRELLERQHCLHTDRHGCDSEKHPLTSSVRPSKFPVEISENLPRRKAAKRPKHPDGLPFVSVERCNRINSGSFELQISEETENGKVVICPSAQLNGSHFMAPQSPGKPRDDLFLCNCRQWFGGPSKIGYHAKQLGNYSCGPKTFIAQSYFDADGHLGGESWWLLQPAVKQGMAKNLFLELKNLEKRPLFARIVASMLRTNVSRNVLLGVTPPFDLVRLAKNGPRPFERLQVAWSYDERNVGKKGLKLGIGKLPWAKGGVELSDATDVTGKTHLSQEKVLAYFPESRLPEFSWYRVAMFESINKTSFMEDEDFEDGSFFLDHFHTAAELRLKLNDPLNPNTTFWGSGEFGGADVTYSSYSDDGRPADGLMFTVSRFTIQKEDRKWPSPRPIDCALYFTFRHGHQASVSTLFTMWKRYESLSSLAGSAAEFPQAGSETPTANTPRFLMKSRNAVFTNFSATDSLDPYEFDPIETFRGCWLLGRRGYSRHSPLNFVLKSTEQDIYCHIYLSATDARNLKTSTKSPDQSISLELLEKVSNEPEETKTSWAWIYPRDPYGVVAPAGFNISGSLKLSFASGIDLSYFLENMQKLLDIAEEALGGSTAPPPPYVAETVPRNIKIFRPEVDVSIATHQPPPTEKSGPTVQSGPAQRRPLSTQELLPAWENLFTPDGDVHCAELESESSHDLLRRKTLPSHSHPPLATGLGLNIKDRTTSWSVGTALNLEQSTDRLHPQVHPSARSTRPTSMYVTSASAWVPPPVHHPAPSPRFLPQHPPPQLQAIPEYRPHPVPTQNWYQQPNSETCVMPDASHFTHYITAADDHSNIHNNMYPGSDNSNYTDSNLVPRDWTEYSGRGRVVSPPRSPLSVFPEDFQQVPPMSNISSAPHSPMAMIHPQQWGGNPANRAGLKRCVVQHEYHGSHAHGEVSLQVGQVYDVIPQHDSPWVWIEAQSPYSPSGFAPAGNFRDCY